MMCIRHTTDNLLKEKSSIFLANIIGLNVVIQLPSFCQLHYYKDIVAGVQNFVQLYDVVMVYELKDSNLPFDLKSRSIYLRNHMFAFHFTLVNYLDSHTDPSKVVSSLYLIQKVHLTLAKPPVPMVFPKI